MGRFNGGRQLRAVGKRAVVASSILVTAAQFASIGPAHAAVPACGSTITQDTKLAGDLVCPRDGLFLGASNITLDLNGYTISGPGPNVRPSPNQIYAGVNILNGRSGVTVTNGTIRGFTIGATSQVGTSGNEFSALMLLGNGQGVLTQFLPATGASSDNNRIRQNTIEASTGANGPAVLLFGSGQVFTANTVRNNQGSGIVVRGRNATISANQVTGNSFVGIELQGGTASSVANNSVRGNQASGIQINGDDNVVSANSLDGNRGNGILIGGPNSPRRWLNNRIEGNSVSGSGRPDQEYPSIGLFAAESTTVAHNRVVGIRRAAGITVSNNSRGNTISGNQTVSNTDGIFVAPGATLTTVSGNQALQNSDDGIDVDSASTTIRGNAAHGNGDRGVEAVAGVIDGGGNSAAGNGNPQQCSPGIVCT